MRKNDLLAKLTYEHCKKLNKTGHGHATNVSVRSYVDHMFSHNNSRFHYNDFSNLEREYLKSGVIKFRLDLNQGIFDEPEGEVVEAPQPVQLPAAEYFVLDHHPQEMIHFAQQAHNLVNADYADLEVVVEQAIQNE